MRGEGRNSAQKGGVLHTSPHSNHPPIGWKLGTAFHGPASVQKMSAAQIKMLDEAAAAARQAGAPVPEPGSLAMDDPSVAYLHVGMEKRGEGGFADGSSVATRLCVCVLSHALCGCRLMTRR